MVEFSRYITPGYNWLGIGKGIRRNPHQRLRENMLCEATKLSPLCFLQLFTVRLVVVAEFSLTQAFRCIWTMSPHFTRS